MRVRRFPGETSAGVQSRSNVDGRIATARTWESWRARVSLLAWPREKLSSWWRGLQSMQSLIGFNASPTHARQEVRRPVFLPRQHRTAQRDLASLDARLKGASHVSHLSTVRPSAVVSAPAFASSAAPNVRNT